MRRRWLRVGAGLDAQPLRDRRPHLISKLAHACRRVKRNPPLWLGGGQGQIARAHTLAEVALFQVEAVELVASFVPSVFASLPLIHRQIE